MDLYDTQNGTFPPPYEEHIPDSDDAFSHHHFRAACERVSDFNLQITNLASDQCLDSCKKSAQLSRKVDYHRLMAANLTTPKTPLTHSMSFGEEYFSQKNSLRAFTSISVPRAVNKIIMPSYHFARMAGAIIQRRVENHRAENHIVAEILQSYEGGLEQVFHTLVDLHLETPGSLESQIQEKGYYDFVVLVRLLEAFESRYAPPDTIYLLSGRLLRKQYCSGIARAHFTQINDLKREIVYSGLLPMNSWEDLVTTALGILKGGIFEAYGNCLPVGFLRELRKVREEIPGLILYDRPESAGMNTL